jgi:hypothetical protein
LSRIISLIPLKERRNCIAKRRLLRKAQAFNSRSAFAIAIQQDDRNQLARSSGLRTFIFATLLVRRQKAILAQKPFFGDSDRSPFAFTRI